MARAVMTLRPFCRAVLWCCTVVLASEIRTPAGVCTPGPSPDLPGARKQPQQRFIVRFSSYKPLSEHIDAVGRLLGAPAATVAEITQRRGQGEKNLWLPASRHRVAALIPTDFLVLTFAPHASEALKAAIRTKLPGVKDVLLDSVMRAPLAMKQPATTTTTTTSHASMPDGGDTDEDGDEGGEEDPLFSPRGRKALLQEGQNRDSNRVCGDDDDEHAAFLPNSTATARALACRLKRRVRSMATVSTAFARSWSFVERSVAKQTKRKKNDRREHHQHQHQRKLTQQRMPSARGGRKDSSFPAGTVTSKGASSLHAQGFKGQGVKVAVFDTGLHDSHPHFKNVVERINWTEDKQLHDGIGHGSFVAGVVCSSSEQCPGWAPEADLYVFRVFTNQQVSYTSWFLDAFNYAIWRGIDVLNLSIGGPDNGDRPFVEKIWEMTANGIIVVSAIGNDGPLYGTLNNPADQYDTIGVGGSNAQGAIAKFSSRGMSTWELPFGYGRFKPDLTALGSSVIGSKMKAGKGGSGGEGQADPGCRALSGTSVASPVVAGAVALLLGAKNKQQLDLEKAATEREQQGGLGGYLSLASSSHKRPLEEAQRARMDVATPIVGPGHANFAAQEQRRRQRRASPAALKQSLVESATLHIGSNVFEQGAGALNVSKAWELLQTYEPHASFLPASLEFAGAAAGTAGGTADGADADAASGCPYLWPYCTQPLYHTAQPLVANVTLINGLGLSGTVSQVSWTQTHLIPLALPMLASESSSSSSGSGSGSRRAGSESGGDDDVDGDGGDDDGSLLEVRCEWPALIWPWSGYVGVMVSVGKRGRAFDGVVRGFVSLTVTARHDGDGITRSQRLTLPLSVRVVPVPDRSKRLLWDQFHSLNYPSGYFPRDNLKVQGDMLDWTGDHIHTNFRDAYASLRERGYFVEVLSGDFTCFDARNYGALLIVDPEEEFFEAEIEKVERDVREKGLGLVVFADWYSHKGIHDAAFFDDNTRSQWAAVTGGANVPALNDLLRPFGVAFNDRVFDGAWSLSPAAKAQVGFLSGVGIAQFPFGGWLRGPLQGELKERDAPQGSGGRLRGKNGNNKNRDGGGSGSSKGSGAGEAHKQYARPLPKLLGAFHVCDTPTGCAGVGGGGSGRTRGGGGGDKGGQVVVYGDSSCLDSWQRAAPLCAHLLAAAVAFAVDGTRARDVFRDEDRVGGGPGGKSRAGVGAEAGAGAWEGGVEKGFEEDPQRPLPTRLPDRDLTKYSNVLPRPGTAPGEGPRAGESCRWSDRLARI